MTQDEMDAGVGTEEGAERSSGASAQPEGKAENGVAVAFGRQLKLLRVRAGLDRVEFGTRVGYAAQSVASFEQGRRIPQPEFIDKADRVLDAGGLLVALKEELARSQYPAFFRDMAGLETGAIALSVYGVYAIPGLLQTTEYARAVFQMRRPLLDDDAIERGLSGRLARQAIYDRKPAPLLTFIIDEEVLRRPIGGQAVLFGQLEQLLLIGQKRNVEVQVMPTDREDHGALGGPFTLIDTVQGQRIAYTEAQGDSRMYTGQAKVRQLEARYGIIRSQALTPSESSEFVQKLLGEK